MQVALKNMDNRLKLAHLAIEGHKTIMADAEQAWLDACTNAEKLRKQLGEQRNEIAVAERLRAALVLQHQTTVTELERMNMSYAIHNCAQQKDIKSLKEENKSLKERAKQTTADVAVLHDKLAAAARTQPGSNDSTPPAFDPVPASDGAGGPQSTAEPPGSPTLDEILASVPTNFFGN
jgi:cell division protein FtsB